MTDALAKYIEPHLADGKVVIPEVIKDETLKNVWEINTKLAVKAKIASPINTRKMVNKSIANFGRLFQNGSLINDEITLLENVKAMYDDIWNDPSKDVKKANWAKRKKCNISEGPPTGFDLLLLSTAAKLAENFDVKVLTCDYDLIAFTEEIESSLNMRLIDGFYLI